MFGAPEEDALEAAPSEDVTPIEEEDATPTAVVVSGMEVNERGSLSMDNEDLFLNPIFATRSERVPRLEC